MALVLYATYLYGRPDRRPAIRATGEPASEYEPPKDEEREMDEGDITETTPAISAIEKS